MAHLLSQHVLPLPLALSLAGATTLTAGIGLPAYANHLNFTLYNESGRTISRLYVSPSSSDMWGRDVLGTDVLNNGFSTRISFPGQSENSPCWWDVKVVFGDGSSSTGNYNLCQTRSITVE